MTSLFSTRTGGEAQRARGTLLVALHVKRLFHTLLFHPFTCRCILSVTRGRIRRHGCLIETADSNLSVEWKTAIFWGLYERFEMRLVRQYLRRDLDVVDLGSNIGVVASQALRMLQPGRRLVAVEANPTLIDVLQRNVLRNAGKHEVRVVNRAIAGLDEGAEVLFGGSGITLAMQRLVGAESGGAHYTVRTATLSSILADHGIGEFALICDIEGAELEILLHDAAALSRCRQMIIELHDVEWNGRVLTPDDLSALLQERFGFILRGRFRQVFLFEAE